MKKILLFVLFPVTVIAQRDYTQLVNPFIGTGGHGHTYPGASMPFGMIQLSPDTRMADWDGSSGYHYSDSVIYGFSHTHLSGTGIPDYCDLLLMPFTGEPKWNNKEYRSSFSHKNEKASPGYYEVLLDRDHIKAQLAAGTRSGMHQYSFPKGTKDASILIDLEHRDEVLDAYIEKVNDHEIRGFRRSKSWAQDQYFYFYIVFDQPIKTFVADNGNLSGSNVKVAISFGARETVRVKVGISAVSTDGAKKNLDAEIKDWDLDRIVQRAKTAWNKELGKIDIKGGTKDQQVCFYTALYHTMIVPNIFQDVNGQYRGTDKEIHLAKDFTNYTVFSLWDTYRAYHPLMTIINQKRTRDWILTFLNQHRNGGMLPVWELAGNETYCMIGYHSVSVIADAYRKGVFRGNERELLQAMTAYARSDRFGLNYYRQSGYLSNDKEHESVSKTLEYAYDDWCIAEFAKMTGNKEVYDEFIKRAQYYKNVFDPSTLHMRGKVQAMWHSPFDPKEINNFFTEGNSWQYSFAVPQDIETLIQLYGGKEMFAHKLNELFTTSSVTTGREQADVTGLIGQYAHGNEPSHHMAYLFNYAGMPWRTQELVHYINTEFYKNSPDGLIGNEDCGQMSAWFILSAMGFYPVCPGNGEYVLGTPLFDEVTLNLENGKKFVIKAKRNTPNAFYVNNTALNKKKYAPLFIRHADIMKGGLLEFDLSGKIDTARIIAKEDLPHSVITSDPIVIVPAVEAISNKFREKTTVTLSTLTKGADIYYKWQHDSVVETGQYKKPLSIDATGKLEAMAITKTGASAQVVQEFHRIPGDISINVLSKVHPMYTAGGPEALVDDIQGTTNWRSGEWQSYFGTDFEAVIDLQHEKHISRLGIHVLEDVGPWILFPKEVIFYSSADGKNYTEVLRAGNRVYQEKNRAQVQVLGGYVNINTRYLKVKAVNGGPLPDWHESAGNPSHLFIDEVIVK